jgi:hypothetical protein
MLEESFILAGVGNKLSSVGLSSTDVAPSQIHAFYQEIKPEDLREGMYNIIHSQLSVHKEEGVGSTFVNSEIGYITAIKIVETPTQKFAVINSYIEADNYENNQAREYTITLDGTTWDITGKFYQEYRWNRFAKKTLRLVDYEVVKTMTIRNQFVGSDASHSIVYKTVSESEWNALVKSDENSDNTYFYYLEPQPSKVLREQKEIPPMPGQKPNKPETQPQPEETEPKPADDIPPMPGSSQQKADLEARAREVKLNENWWGTKDKNGGQ